MRGIAAKVRSGCACSIALVAAAASLPSCRARSLSAVQGMLTLPVDAATLSASAMFEAAPAKSPTHARAMPSAERKSGSCPSAPASRTSWTCRAAIVYAPSLSHTALLAAVAIQPQRRTSSTGMSASTLLLAEMSASRRYVLGRQEGESLEQQVK